MNLESMNDDSRARVYPVSDALQQPLVPVISRQRVPQNPRLRLKKLVGNKAWQKRGKIRVGNWNVGSLTGKGRELVEVMQRRNIDILCIQETRWRGKRAKLLGDGFKIYYSGDSTRRNGVGIILHPDLQDKVLDVVRMNGRMMALKLVKAG